MTPAERRTACLLVVSIFINGLLQTAVLVGVVPVVQAMIDPTAATSGRFFSWLRPWIGFAVNENVLLAFGLGLAILVIARTAFGWLQIRWMSRFSQQCEMRMTTMVMRQVVHAPYEWLLLQNSERVREILFGHSIQWSRDFIRMLMQIGNDVIFVVFLLAALVLASPASGLIVAFSVMAVGIGIFAAVRPRLMQLAQAKRAALIRAHVVSTETIRGIKDVKMAGAEDRHVTMFREQIAIYSGSDAGTQRWRQVPRLGLELLAYSTLIGMSCAVVLSGARGTEMAGLLVLYALAALRILPMVNVLVTSFGTLVGSFPLLVELDYLIKATSHAEADIDGDRDGAEDWNPIQLDSVSYMYPGSTSSAVNAVSQRIERGKSYGIVGPSGGGKSTLIDLIAGLIAPTAGSISAGGRNLDTEAARLKWRRRFGYVAQRPFLLDASLRENIVFGFDDGRDEIRLSKALTLAKLDNVLRRLPGGLEGGVGEQGAALSGGERQRVAIARALYRGADILILDEATSALDSLVEREIAESIEQLHGRVTTIVVSHRLGFVRSCDEIWVVDDARILAAGDHACLLGKSELYGRMMEAQEPALLAATTPKKSPSVLAEAG
ncbi:MAG: ABC transporter ATP-binding protein [Pseudorhodoplanes sp.]